MKTNTQPTERLWRDPSGDLEVVNVFQTIQGEGPFAGRPATFVRLAGCNLQCPGCDTDYTSHRTKMRASEVASVVRHTRKPVGPAGISIATPLVVITGGEPFRQNLTPFVNILLGIGYVVQIETNGTHFLNDFPYSSVTIVCSPKTGKLNYDLAKRVNAFKYVLEHGKVSSDGLPFATLRNEMQSSVARPPLGSTAEIYVQPLDEQSPALNAQHLDATVKSVLQFGYRLCIQTHKLANVP